MRLALPRSFLNAACLGSILLLSACTGAATPTGTPIVVQTTFMIVVTVTPAPTPISGEVSFMVFGEPAGVQAFQNVADAFEAANPGIKVTLIPVAGSEEEYHAKLGSDLAGGQPADVVLIDYDAASEFFETGAFQPLTEMLAASSLVKPGDLYPQPVEAFRSDDEQMCMPLSAGSLVVYYNKTLFDAAGQAYPKAGWTWDQFLAAAQALTKDTDGDGKTDQFGVDLHPTFNQVLPFIWSNGGDLLADGGKALALDTPAAREAIQFVVDWQSKYHIAPSQAEEQALDGGGRFEDGTLAMFIDSPETMPNLHALSDAPAWDIAPLPQKTQAANILKSDGVCLTAKAKQPALGWKLIEYLASPDGQDRLAVTGRVVPVNIAVAQANIAPVGIGPLVNRPVWLDNIPLIRTVPPLKHWPDIEERANEEIESAFYGHTTGDEAVQEITDQAGPFLQP